MADSPRTVLITGASSGIGRAAARRLDELGMTVLAGVRLAEDGESLASVASPRLRPILLDVTQADQVEAAARLAGETVGQAGLFGLVSNAGTGVFGPIESTPSAEFREQFEVNVFGPLALLQACLPLVRRARGRVVLTGSISGRSSMPLVGPYCMSKFALEALADALRVELRSAGVRVSLLDPGAIDTPIWEKNLAACQRAIEHLTPGTRAVYGRWLAALHKTLKQSRRGAADPARAAERIVHALTARRPRARYYVGPGSRMARLLERLPVRLRDWLIATHFNRTAPKP